MLKLPVDKVDLKLTEFHVFAVCFEKTAYCMLIAVSRKTEVFYFALFFHLDEVVADAVLRIEICIDIFLADIVEQIKIKILRLAFFELLVEDFFYLRHIGKVVAGELVREKIAFSAVTGERLAECYLAQSVMVAPCGIKIINAAFYRFVHHVANSAQVGLFGVVAFTGQTHCTEAERGNLNILKIIENHFLQLLQENYIKKGALKQCFF